VFVGIKAVVFDYGKVISFSPSASDRKKLAFMTGLPAKKLDELERKYRFEYDLGTFNGREYYKSILVRAGIFLDDERLEKIAGADMDRWRRINPETEKLMSDIKKTGCKVGILSNMPYDFLFWAREHIPLFTKNDGAVFSCEERELKPNAAIYKILLSRLGCGAQEVVFFDDIPHNVKGASALGIRSFVWKKAETARKVLKKTDRCFADL
jgi:putative hydrolase of the HAD superfamily